MEPAAQRQIARLRRDRDELEQRVATLIAETDDYAGRVAELEDENDSLELFKEVASRAFPAVARHYSAECARLRAKSRSEWLAGHGWVPAELTPSPEYA